MKHRLDFCIVILFSVILINSCVKTPVDNSPVNDFKAKAGDIFVLCEGLQGYDNSAITLINTSTGESLEDYFKSSNPGEFLGDTSNDILQKGDTAIIALSTASIVRLIRISDGKRLKEINLPEDCKPRKLALINDSVICVSCLLRSSVYVVNINNEKENYEVPVGPQPEGITFYNNMIFAANSAYGDFNYKHPDAETVSIISTVTKQEIRKIKAGPNCSEVLVNPKRNTLYAVYYHLPSKEDSAGGIIEYDISTLQQTRSWKIRARSVNISISSDSLFFISQMPKGSSMSEQSGVSVIDLNTGNSELIIKNPGKFNIWYSLSVSPYDCSVWICNAKNHVNNGEILVYQSSNYTSPLRKFNVSQNPNKVLFIRE